MTHPRELTRAAKQIFIERYLLKDKDGQVIETPDELFRRVAKAVAKAEKPGGPQGHWAEKFYEGMSSLTWLPNSPTLLNAGAGQDGKNRGCLSACFQLTPEDDEEDILDTAKRMGMILKHGGGVGIALSKLRPQGSPIKSTHGIAHGPVLALREVFRAVPRQITQGGVRQAANMCILHRSHPDIEKFITVKKDHLPNGPDDPGMALYNISVATDDEFFRTFDQEKNKQLFDKITEMAWQHGCPGFYFIDHANKDNLLLRDYLETENPYYFHGVNPCGEQSLPSTGSCTLASINIARFFKGSTFDKVGFGLCVKTVIRFLDDVLTINTYPDEKIAEYALFSRDIGLGIMGLTDVFTEAGVEYGSPESLALCDTVMTEMARAAREASEDLAQERGPAPAMERIRKIAPRRNTSLLVVAPTGSLSIFADCVGGVEPLFAPVELRKQGGIEYFNIPRVVRQFLKPGDLDKLDKILSSDKITKEKMTLAEELIRPKLPKFLKTAHEIHWRNKLDVIATIQKYVDRGISHTLNLPHDAKLEDVRESAIYAWEQGLKGWTCYRDGSIPQQPYTALSTLQQQQKTEVQGLFPVPDVVPGEVHKVKVDIDGKEPEHVYITVGFIPGTKKPFEVFVSGRVQNLSPIAMQQITLTTRLVSTCLRARAPLAEVIKQLERTEGQWMYSIPLSIAKVLSQYLLAAGAINGARCPDCGEPTLHGEGCEKCTICGWSRCS